MGLVGSQAKAGVIKVATIRNMATWDMRTIDISFMKFPLFFLGYQINLTSAIGIEHRWKLHHFLKVI